MADARDSDGGDDNGDWRHWAACRKSAVDFFDEEQYPAAIRTCRSCPVLVPCRTSALAERPPDGVWGGLTPRDRLVIGRKRPKHGSVEILVT